MTVIFPFAAGLGSATSAADETTLLKALRQAHAFIAKLQKPAAQRPGGAAAAVVVSLSAEAAQRGSTDGEQPDPVAHWREALTDRQKADENAIGQLMELNKQMRRSRHDQALQRLQQLLAQYRALRALGASAAKALSALAKDIKAAANELAASGDGGAGESATDTAGSVVAAASVAVTAGGTADIVAAVGASGNVAKAAPITADAATPTASTGSEDERTSTSVPGEAAPSESTPSQAWARQLIDQTVAAGAAARQRAQDDLLLQQARAALSDIERLAKQVDDENRRKGAAGKSGVGATAGLDVIV